MAIREQDLTVITAWAASYAPEGGERLSLRADVDGHRVTIVESVRLDPAADPADTTIAQLRFTALTELWSLCSADAAGERVSTLLAAIDADEHGRFWR